MRQLRAVDLVVRAFGWRGILRRGWYVARLRSGWFRRTLTAQDSYAAHDAAPWTYTFDVDALRAQFAQLPDVDALRAVAVDAAERALEGDVELYGWMRVDVGWPPRWHVNPGTGVAYPRVHWTQISDDDPGRGDIKDVWELSRLQFTFDLARAHVLSDDDRFAEAWWEALEHWIEENPPNIGVNWRCGQETSLRAIAVQFGLSTFAAHPASSARRMRLAKTLLATSVARVRPTVGYALSQRNNHAISELVFLLSMERTRSPRLERLLREAVTDQFAADGSYSQQSFVYHRLAVSCLAWLLRVRTDLDGRTRDAVRGALARSAELFDRSADPVRAQLPNYGPNDGSSMFRAPWSAHLDAAPTLALLGRSRGGTADDLTLWLGAPLTGFRPAAAPAKATRSTYWTLRGTRSLLLTRLGRGVHRAADDDQQAIELLIDGARVVLDPGAYRYSGEEPWRNPFTSVHVHSTPRASGNAAQSLRVGRFLREPMPAAVVVAHRAVTGGEILVSRRADGAATLTRAIVRIGNSYAVVDRADGSDAIVRWNLPVAEQIRCEVDLGAPGASPLGRDGADPRSGWWSPAYARVEPCDAYEIPLPAGATTVARFSPAGEALLPHDQVIALVGDDLAGDLADDLAGDLADATQGEAMTRTVLVFNHFAQPRSAPGGTRHVELFSRLDGWDARVLASNRNLLDGQRIAAERPLETVWAAPYEGNGLGRIVNWASYAATALWRGVRARRIDVVYGSSPHLLSALSALVVARLRRKPFVLEIRDVWPKVLVDMGTLAETSLLYRALERLETLLYRRAERIVYMAEGVRDHIEARGVDGGRLVFIPNGADAADFQPSQPRDVLRERYGFEGVVAVYTGAHGPANGLDLLLDAARTLAGTAPAVTVVLVGAGAEKQRLVARARDEGLANVRFLDPIPKTEIPDLLAAADIGIHCLADVELFRSGVSPNKLFDYMAAGLAVITNTPGVVTDFVDASGGGLAVDPHGLAAGLERLARLDDAARRELGASGQRHLDATRSRTAMAARIEALLDDVVRGPSVASAPSRMR